jgi:rubrerythrin
MFKWAQEEPVQDGGDGPHDVWRCRDCWARNVLTLVETAHGYQTKIGDVRSEDCPLCDGVAQAFNEPNERVPWDLVAQGRVSASG